MAISGNGVIWVEISKVLIQIRHDQIKLLLYNSSKQTIE
jgi:hypothetical protein